MIKPSFRTFLKKSKFKKDKAKLYSDAYDKILDEGLFDEDFYYKMYPSIKDAGINPLVHYLFHGYLEGKVPSLKFEGNQYLHNYEDVNMNPLVHYVLFGKDEGRVSFNSPILSHYYRILDTNKLFLNNYVFDEEPLVSIIILNLNGLTHLKRLFSDFELNTNYSNYELIVVDNGSSDGSIEYLNSLKGTLPLKLIENSSNKSFSEANNQAVKVSSGEFILLLNNDMEPTYGWLNEMIGTLLKDDGIGAVGSKLIYPYYYGDEDNFKSYLIQHAGDIFDERIKPCCAYAYNANKFEHAYDVKVNKTKDVVAVTAASVLIRRNVYLELEGLDEAYFYGFEDVDFMLKLNKAGYRIVYCASSLLFHHESSTRIKDKETYEENNINNTKTLWTKQGNFITKGILEDKLESKGFFTEKPFKFSFLIEDFDINSPFYDLVSSLAKVFNKKGYDVELITSSLVQRLSDDSDILLSFSSNYNLEDLVFRENIIKVLVSDEEINNSSYDIVLPSENLVSSLLENIEAYVKSI